MPVNKYTTTKKVHTFSPDGSSAQSNAENTKQELDKLKRELIEKFNDFTNFLRSQVAELEKLEKKPHNLTELKDAISSLNATQDIFNLYFPQELQGKERSEKYNEEDFEQAMDNFNTFWRELIEVSDKLHKKYVASDPIVSKEFSSKTYKLLNAIVEKFSVFLNKFCKVVFPAYYKGPQQKNEIANKILEVQQKMQADLKQFKHSRPEAQV